MRHCRCIAVSSTPAFGRSEISDIGRSRSRDLGRWGLGDEDLGRPVPPRSTSREGRWLCLVSPASQDAGSASLRGSASLWGGRGPGSRSRESGEARAWRELSLGCRPVLACLLIRRCSYGVAGPCTLWRARGSRRVEGHAAHCAGRALCSVHTVHTAHRVPQAPHTHTRCRRLPGLRLGVRRTALLARAPFWDAAAGDRVRWPYRLYSEGGRPREANMRVAGKGLSPSACSASLIQTDRKRG